MASGAAAPGSQGQSTASPRDARLIEYDRYIERQIRKTRGQVKWVDISTALVGLIAGSLVYLLLVILLDHWVAPGGLGTLGRILCFLIFIAGLGAYFTLVILPLLIKRINPVYAAQAIERRAPSLKNSLVNFLLLRSSGGVSRSVFEAIEAQAASGLTNISVEAAIDRSRLIKLGWALVAVVALFAGYKFLSPKDPFASIGRAIIPWADIPAPTRVHITRVTPGPTTTYQEQTVEVEAMVRGLRSSDQVVVVYSSLDGEIVDKTISMQPNSAGQYTAVLPAEGVGLRQDIVYYVKAGDAVSPKYPIDVVIPPAIVVESIEYTYPAYTGLPPRRVDGQPDIKELEGVQVKITARANQAIQSAYLDFGGDGKRDVKMQAQGEVATVSFPLRLKRDKDGRPTVEPEYDRYQILFTNAEGQENLAPSQHVIQVIRDLPPVISFALPESKNRGEPLAANGMRRFAIDAWDPDFKLGRAELVFEKDGKELLKQSLLDAPRAGKLHASYLLDAAKLNVKPGDEVTFYAVAEDNKQPEPNRVVTNQHTFTIEGDVPPAERRRQEREAKGAERNQRDRNRGEQGQAQNNGERSDDPQSETGDQGQGEGERQPQEQRQQDPRKRDERRPPDAQERGDRSQQEDSGQGEAEAGSGQGQARQQREPRAGEQQRDQQSQRNGDQPDSPQPRSEQSEGEAQEGERQSGDRSSDEERSKQADEREFLRKALEKARREKEQAREPNSQREQQPNDDRQRAQDEQQQQGEQRQGDRSQGAQQQSQQRQGDQPQGNQQQREQQQGDQQQGESGQEQSGQQAGEQSQQRSSGGQAKGDSARPMGGDAQSPSSGDSDSTDAAQSSGPETTQDPRGGESPRRLMEQSQKRSDGGADPDQQQQPGEPTDPNAPPQMNRQQRAGEDQTERGLGRDRVANQEGTENQSGEESEQRKQDRIRDINQNAEGQAPNDSRPQQGPQNRDAADDDRSVKASSPQSSGKGRDQYARGSQETDENDGAKQPGLEPGPRDKNNEKVALDHELPDETDKTPGDQRERPKDPVDHKPSNPERASEGPDKPIESEDSTKYGAGGMATQEDTSKRDGSQERERQDGQPQKDADERKGVDEQQKGSPGAGQNNKEDFKTPFTTQRGPAPEKKLQENDKRELVAPDEPDTMPNEELSTRETDSKGGQSGENTGGGKEGHGQRAKEQGKGAPGEQTATDDGGSESQQSGDAAKSQRGGSKEESQRPTGGESSGEKGPGSTRQQGGDKSGSAGGQPQGAEQPTPKKDEGSNAAEGGNDGARREPRPMGERQPNQQQPGEQPGAQQQQKQPQPGQRQPANNQGAQPEGAPRGDQTQRPPGQPMGQQSDSGQGDASGANTAGTLNNPGGIPQGDIDPSAPSRMPPSQGEETPAEAPNLEYAREATELTLQYLKDQLERGQVDQELLNETGWTREDMQRFVERWEQLKQAAREPGKKGAQAERALNEALRNLDLRSQGTSLEGRTTGDDNRRGYRDIRRSSPPPEYEKIYRSYTRGS